MKNVIKDNGQRDNAKQSASARRNAPRELTRAELEQLGVRGGLNPMPEEFPIF